MFVCELIAPWLLIAPITPVRRVGVVVQLPLQLLIALTGNYNWFNLHTAVLLLPAWAADVTFTDTTATTPASVAAAAAAADRAAAAKGRAARRPQSPAPPDSSSRLTRVVREALSPLRAWEQLWASGPCSWLASIAAVGLLGYAALDAFPISVHLPEMPTRHMAMDDTSPSSSFTTMLRSLAGVLGSRMRMLSLLLSSPDAISIENRADEAYVRSMLDAALQPMALGLYLHTVTAFSIVCYIIEPLASSRVRVARGASSSPVASAAASCLRGAVLVARVTWRSLVGLASIVMLGVIMLPFESIAGRDVSALVPSAFGLRSAAVDAHAALRPYHVSNSYGLFRRMTGVGPRETRGVPARWGWDGLPPSIVQVPVVVLEGHPHARDGASSGGGGDGDGWVEIPFRYVPYGEARAPRRTAPHQPRLDWQMWFAALGTYEHNPWLLHLVYKILLGHERRGGKPSGGDGGGMPPSAAVSLLDLDASPFRVEPPARVRAALYHYDFTRLDSPWARRIPQAPVLPSNCSLLGPFAAAAGEACGRWWRRVRVREYLPPVDRQMLEQQVVRGQGWPLGGAAAPADPCHAAQAGKASKKVRRRHAFIPRPVCEAIVALRRTGAPIRRFVGFSLGGSPRSAAFVDGPLLVIMSVVAAPLLLRHALAACTARSQHARRDSG